MNKIELLQKIIDESDNIVFFGGAGVSTESGIKDFRGENGLYKEHYDYPPEFLLSSDCFYNKQEVFYDFYKNKMNSVDIEPNVTHKYLTMLEKEGKLKAIITQNIDGLHQKAGSKNVLEIHGTIHENHCLECGKEYDANYVFNSKGIPKCKCGGVIKPDVVLYGEMLPECFNTALEYISKCDTLIVAGTSLTVEPASSLVRLFKGKNLVIINKDNTLYDNIATLVINDKLSNIFSKLK
ncbi:MAG TPA: NAD-dependent protein deacylase [Firmicutes bacterium]|nr:NAD-dependent protein deacylase [Bacillota bacterium]